MQDLSNVQFHQMTESVLGISGMQRCREYPSHLHQTLQGKAGGFPEKDWNVKGKGG